MTAVLQQWINYQLPIVVLSVLIAIYTIYRNHGHLSDQARMTMSTNFRFNTHELRLERQIQDLKAELETVTRERDFLLSAIQALGLQAKAIKPGLSVMGIKV